MNSFKLFLKITGPVFFAVAALHLVLGIQADVMLGAQVPLATLHDPVLDSQNRFYGTSFALFGALLVLSARDPEKYAAVIRCVLWAMLAGGLARLVSIAIVGLPSPPVLALLAIELVIPPLALVWLRCIVLDARA